MKAPAGTWALWRMKIPSHCTHGKRIVSVDAKNSSALFAKSRMCRAIVLSVGDGNEHGQSQANRSGGIPALRTVSAASAVEAGERCRRKRRRSRAAVSAAHLPDSDVDLGGIRHQSVDASAQYAHAGPRNFR